MISPRSILGSIWTPIAVIAAFAVYLLVVPAKEYESQSTFFVKTAQGGSAGASDLFSAILQSGSNLSRTDSEIIQEFVLSRRLFRQLDEEFDLQERWSEEWLGLSPDSPEEDFFEHYVKRVRVDISQIGILSLRYRDTSADIAQKTVQMMIEESEIYLNSISHQMANEQVGFAQRVVERTTRELEEKSTERNRYAGQFQTLDPKFEAEIVLNNISSLEMELSRLVLERRQKAGILSEDSAQIRAIDNQIQGLRSQIQDKREELVSDHDSLDEVLLRYQRLEAAEHFAREAFQSALRSLEAIRLDASRNISTLVRIDAPTLSAEANYPRFLYSIFTCTLLVFLAFGLLKVGLKLAEDHR